MNYRGTDLAWAAGFLEGEGCFKINFLRGGRNVGPAVTATQVDKAPLERLQKLFGGGLKSEKARGVHSAYWTWTVSTNFCRNELALLIPHMTGSKKKEAVFLNSFALSLRPQNGVPVSNSEIIRRRKAYDTLSQMKLRNQ